MTTEATTNAVKTIDRDAVYSAVAETYRRSLEQGGGLWYYVRVWPDGDITTGIEASPMYPESEYYHREPHPVTVWDCRSNSDLGEAEIKAEMDAMDDEWLALNVGDLGEKLRPTGLLID